MLGCTSLTAGPVDNGGGDIDLNGKSARGGLLGKGNFVVGKSRTEARYVAGASGALVTSGSLNFTLVI